jgi:hypothetical protein
LLPPAFLGIQRREATTNQDAKENETNVPMDSWLHACSKG